MTTAFDPRDKLIIVPGEVFGPAGSAVLRLALDTGASQSLINFAMLVTVGYDPASTTKRIQATTGSSVEFVPEIRVERFRRLIVKGSAFRFWLIHYRPVPESMA